MAKWNDDAGAQGSLPPMAADGPGRQAGRQRISRRWATAGTLAGLFALAHTGYWLAGIRFDASPLRYFWQFLDPELLRHRLLESLLYLHIQPPLFNLFLGLVLKLGLADPTPLFWAIYVGCGLALYLALFELMQRLGVSEVLAFVLSTWFMVSPSFVLYEHWLFYTFPLALLLTLSALALHAFLAEGRGWQAAAFCGLLFLLAGTRSLFQWPYYLVSVGGVGWAWRERRRVLASAAVVPLLLLLALYGKNLVLFGRFATSSWLGMNLWGVVSRNVPLAERQAWVAAGEVSPLALIDRFAPLDQYPSQFRGPALYAGVPAVSQLYKSTGAVNYNHIGYLAVSDQYLRDALAVALHRPRFYLLGVAKGWFHYFRSSSDYLFLEANRKRIALLNALYDYLFYGKLPFDLSKVPGLPLNEGDARHAYLFLLIGLPMLVGFGLRAVWRGEPARRTVIAYLCFAIMYVAFTGNLLEVGENNRFRFMTDPLYVVLLGLLLQAVASRLQAGRLTCGGR